jgi:FtsP/CotA-like multicopper oxidase with cupredoxin domain
MGMEMEKGMEMEMEPEASSDMHAGHPMRPDVTRAQKVVIGLLSVLALTAGVAWSLNYANLGIGSEDVNGAVMPPGMVQARDIPAEAMKDMAAVDLNDVTYKAGPDEQGDQVLAPSVAPDGTKVFDLETSVIEWYILEDVQVGAYAVNRQVPGPRLVVTQGDRVRINVTNRLPEPTSLHWHGLVLPNAMDGVGEVTQRPIEPGETFTYEFTVTQAGTYFYHSHERADRQQPLGLYGALIVNPSDPAVDSAYNYQYDLVIQLQEWLYREGWTFPAMPMEGALPNYFTINGKAYPDTPVLKMRVGERVRVRFIGSSAAFIHPMHIHGGPFEIVETDGNPVQPSARLLKDTVNVGPGERYDVIWTAREPGRWLVHCHILHHTTNNNVEENGGGGLTMVLEVSP